MQKCVYTNLLLFLYVNIVKILGDDKVGIYKNLVAISWKRAVHEEPLRQKTGVWPRGAGTSTSRPPSVSSWVQRCTHTSPCQSWAINFIPYNSYISATVVGKLKLKKKNIGYIESNSHYFQYNICLICPGGRFDI